MIDTEQILNDKDFFKSFKNATDLESFSKSCIKELLSKCLRRNLIPIWILKNIKEPKMEIIVMGGIMDKIQAVFLFSYLDNMGNSLTFASSV